MAQTPLHVGGLGADVDTDLPLARDSADRYYVPGTSVAGTLRAWCAEVFDAPSVKKVWGFQDGEQGDASWVFVEDAIVPAKVVAEVRDGVGIDRVWGCAAEHIKYDRAVLPRGTPLPFQMTVDVWGQGDQARDMVGALLGALERGEVLAFGAPHKRAAWVGCNCNLRPRSRNSALGTMPPGSRASWRCSAAACRMIELPPVMRRRPRLSVMIEWHPVGPLMVKSGMDGVGVDTLPLMSGLDDPRARAARQFHQGLLPQPGRTHHSDLAARHRRRSGIGGQAALLKHTETPLVEELFGSPGQDKETVNQKPSHLGRGALGVDDCFATCTVPRDLWQQILLAAPDALPNQDASELRRKLEDARAGFANWTAAFHVAVDRWTGGAADGFLYSVPEPHGVAWEPLRSNSIRPASRIADRRR